MENTSNTQHGERAEGWPALPMADDAVAFPTLDDSELAVLEALGTRRSVVVGEYLYREGDATYDFDVILSGAAVIVVRSDGEERIVARHGPGRFLGELNLLTGQRVYLSARIVEPGEVIVVPRAALHHLIATAPGLSDTILAAFLARRSALLSGASAAIRVVGSRFSLESLRIREFLARNRIPHEWLDPRSRRCRRTPCARVRRHPWRTAGRDRLRLGLAPPNPWRAGGVPRLDHQQPSRALFRPRRGRCGASRSSGGCLRCLRGTANPGRRDGRRRGPGRDQLAHRELPRVSDRDLRRRPHPAGRRASGEVRRPPHEPVRGLISA